MWSESGTAIGRNPVDFRPICHDRSRAISLRFLRINCWRGIAPSIHPGPVIAVTGLEAVIHEHESKNRGGFERICAVSCGMLA